VALPGSAARISVSLVVIVAPVIPRSCTGLVGGAAPEVLSA